MCDLQPCRFLADFLGKGSTGVFVMAFFEQAAVLATAWANNAELKALGAKHSLCVIKSKKLTRRHLHAYPWLIACMYMSKKTHHHACMHVLAKVMLQETRMSSVLQWISWGFVPAKRWWSKRYTNFFPFASLVAKKLTVACTCMPWK